MNRHALTSSFFLLNADHVALNHKWNYKNITSTFYRLYLVDGGAGRLYHHQTTVELEPGYLYLIPSFTPCSYICDCYLSQYYLSFIEESVQGNSLFAGNRRLMKTKASAADKLQFTRLLQINPNRGLMQTHNPNVYEKRPVLQNFQSLNNELSFAAYTETTGIILQLLARFLTPDHFKPGYLHHIPSKIHDAIDFIQTNLALTITIQELADRANQNADYFSRLFKNSTGERPLKYIQSLRIERAQTLLSSTDLPFSEIANATGFDSAAYFSRIFKQATGQTPFEFKSSCTMIKA